MASNLFKLPVEAPQEAVWVRPTDFLHLCLVRPICLINGAFDLLHSGHMKLIRTARDRCATLVCALDSDRKIREAKGVGRPVMSFVERAVALDYLEINYIVEIDSDPAMKAVVECLRPDFRVLGEDYIAAATRFPDVPRFFIPRTDKGLSTTEIITRCKGVT